MVKPLASTSQKVPTRPVGDVEVSNTKGGTFKARFTSQIVFVLLICVAVYSRFYSIREAARLEWPGNLLWYNYLTFLTLLWIPSVTLTQDETLPLRVFCKPSAAFLIMFELIVFGITAIFGIYIYFLKCMIANIITFISLIWFASHFHLFSYNPFSQNDKYSLARAVSRNDANQIQIIESRSLEITLYNQGSEAFLTDNCILKRTIVKGKERIAFVELALPSFTVEPFQKLTIVPLSEAETDKVALTVERLRCFGVDVGDKVITTLKLDKKDVSELEQHFIHCDFWDNQRGFTKVVETIFAKNGPQAVELM